MNRRAFLFASLFTGLAAPALVSTARAAGPIRMIFVSGQDCSYCRMWRNRYEESWRASPEFRHVTWTEIEPAHLREAYQARYWPSDLRDVLDQVPRKSGTPRFLIVRDGEIVSNELGVNRWGVTLNHLRNLPD
jgi:hypothetical protein